MIISPKPADAQLLEIIQQSIKDDENGFVGTELDEKKVEMYKNLEKDWTIT